MRSYLPIAKAKRASARLRSEGRPTSPFGDEWVIADAPALARAIRLVELGKAKGNEAAIRDWIRKRAAALGLSSMIPTPWAVARSRRAHPGSDASVEGEEDEPRYTQAEIDKLGAEGKAFKKRDGTFGWPTKDRRDLLNAIQAFGRAKPSEAAAVKAYIKLRARLMGYESLLPASWQSKAKLKYVDGDGEVSNPDSAPSMGGQE